MGAAWTQTFPPSPAFTKKDLPSLKGRVFIVTAGNDDIGLELVKILYSQGGTVYIASRSPTKITSASETIKSTVQTSNPGILNSLHLDLDDLTTVQPCVSDFLQCESRLDVLFNNAGIAHVPVGSITIQGHEVHIGTNCLGHFLLTKLLLPTLESTAKSSPEEASVRVVFLSSGIIELNCPSGGVDLNNFHHTDRAVNYAASKAGNWFLAFEFDRRVRQIGVVCVTLNPGNTKTGSWDRLAWPMSISKILWYEPKMGAYSELWAGLSREVKSQDGGRYGIPWGRWHPCPKEDIVEGLTSGKEGGTGRAEEFWEWCEKQVGEFS